MSKLLIPTAILLIFLLASCTGPQAKLEGVTILNISCDNTPHGGQVSRTRYELANPDYGTQCNPETQTRDCNNGTWSSWTGKKKFSKKIEHVSDKIYCILYS